MHAGPEIDAHAAAAVVDLPVRTARRMLDGLVDTHLLEQPSADRYRFHDLLGSYAAELARDEDPDHVLRAAVERLLGHYTYWMMAAIEIVEPGELTAGWQPSTDPSVRFGGREEATTWLAAEHRNLIAAAGMAVRHGLPAYAIALSDNLYRHLTHRRYFDDALTLHTHALEAAGQRDDKSGEGRALRWLAGTRGRMGDHQAAAELCERSLSRFRAAGDRLGEYEALYLSAAIKLFLGELAAGREQLEQARALDLGRDAVSANSQARVLKLLAHYSRELGEYDAALQYARESVRIAADLGTRIRGWSWGMLGGALHDLGRYDEAIDAYNDAVRCYQEAGDSGGQSLGINNIGRSLRGLGRLDAALDRHREALTVAREIADRNSQLEAHREMGATLRESGRPDDAIHHLEQALELAGELDQLLDTARANDELARTHLARGDTGRAREHWQEALAVMTDLGLPAAARVRDDLRALDQASSS